jgi:hypothetical protein
LVGHDKNEGFLLRVSYHFFLGSLELLVAAGCVEDKFSIIFISIFTEKISQPYGIAAQVSTDFRMPRTDLLPYGFAA